MAEDSLKVVERVEKALTARNWKEFENLHSEDVVLLAPGMGPVKGRAAVREFYQTFFTAFPDMAPTTLRRFAQGDWACGEYRVTGTHKGPLENPDGSTIPPTNRKITISNCSVYHIHGGKIVEVHEYYDLMGFMAQLGLAPGGEGES